MSTQPVYPTYGNNMATQQSGDSSGVWSWLGPILNLGGNLLSGFSDASGANASRQLQADEFNATYPLQQNPQLLAAQNLLNRAPLADKGQYLALNAAAPTPFQPRDYTQGVQTLRGAPQGGAAQQLAANNLAASNYRKGAGGVDTNTLGFVLRRLGAPEAGYQNAGRSTTVNYNGQQYSPEEWSQFLNQHPDVARTMQGG